MTPLHDGEPMLRVALYFILPMPFLLIGIGLLIGDLTGLIASTGSGSAWLIGTAFIVLTFPFFALGIFQLRRRAEERSRQERARNVEPQPATIYSQQKGARWGWWLFPLALGAFTLFLAYITITGSGVTNAGEKILPVLVVLMSIAWCYLSYRSWQNLRAWHRYGAVPLQVQRHPVTVGDTLAARLELPRQAIARPTFTVELVCLEIHYVRSGTGKNKTIRKHEKRYWSTSATATGETVLDSTQVDIRIDVPPDQPASDLPYDSISFDVDYYKWLLHIESPLRNVPFERDYPIEVLAGEPSLAVTEPLPTHAKKTAPAHDQRKIDAVATVARAELDGGKPPQAIWDRMVGGLGMAPAIVRAGLVSIATVRESPHAEALQGFLSELPNREGDAQDDSSAATTTPDGPWDPLDQRIDPSDFCRAADALRERLDRYREQPGRLKAVLWTLMAVPVITTLLAAYFHETLLPLLASSSFGDGRALLLLPFAIPYLYIRYVYNHQTDLVKVGVAENNGWLYSPIANRQRGRRFSKQFGTMVTDRQRERPQLEDEFWGRYQAVRGPVQFWCGLFHYRVRGRVRINNSSRDKKKTWSALALPTLAPRKTTFLIRALPPRHRWLRLLRHKRIDVNTASAEFNRRFEIYRDGKREADPQGIMRTLSPAVQVRLLDLYRKDGEFAFLFDQSLIAFAYSGRLLRDMKTDFFSRVEVDRKDNEAVQRRLDEVLSISSEIVPFLD